MKLNKAAIAELALPEGKADAIFFDDQLPGFGVRLRRGGARSFIVQYRSATGQRRETLGDCRKLDLDQARRVAKRRLGAVALGHDPQAEKAEKRARAKLTLGSLAPEFLARKRGKVRASTLAATERHLLRRWQPLHDRPVHELTRRDIAARLVAIEKEFGPHSAKASRVALMEFCSWAMAMGLAESNPVIGTPEPVASKARERVLSAAEIAAVWEATDDMGEYGAIVRLLLLLGCRREEIADLRWDEIDLDRGVLAIPGERTKNHRPLVLTLAPLALSIITSIPFCRLHHDRRVFGKGEGGFSAWSQGKAALDARITVMGKALPAWRIHDVRRSTATGMAELGVQPHVIEAVLNHVSGHKAGVAGIYNRASYEREIKAALALWADHINALVEGRPDKIIPLQGRR
jgi:integrase